MRLHEGAVDQFQAHVPALGPYGLDERREREVSCSPKEPIARSRNQPERVLVEGVVRQATTVKLRPNKIGDVIACEPAHNDRVGDPGVDVLIHRETQGLNQFVLGEEHQVVARRKLPEEESEFAQTVDIHHSQLTTTQLYTQVSIAHLQRVHAMTHPARLQAAEGNAEPGLEENQK